MYRWLIEKVTPLLYDYLIATKQKGAVTIRCMDNELVFKLAVYQGKLVFVEEHHILSIELDCVNKDYRTIFANSVGHILSQAMTKRLDIEMQYTARGLICPAAE